MRIPRLQVEQRCISPGLLKVRKGKADSAAADRALSLYYAMLLTKKMETKRLSVVPRLGGGGKPSRHDFKLLVRLAGFLARVNAATQ